MVEYIHFYNYEQTAWLSWKDGIKRLNFRYAFIVRLF